MVSSSHTHTHTPLLFTISSHHNTKAHQIIKHAVKWTTHFNFSRQGTKELYNNFSITDVDYNENTNQIAVALTGYRTYVSVVQLSKQKVLLLVCMLCIMYVCSYVGSDTYVDLRLCMCACIHVCVHEYACI